MPGQRPVLNRLLSPINLGPFELPIRLISAGHLPFYSVGTLSDREIAFHARKVEGGFPLTITGANSVHPSGGGASYMVSNYDDSAIPGYRKLAAAVHAHGARVMVQLGHLAGSWKSAHTGDPSWAPSPMMGEYARDFPHVMTTREVEVIVEAYYRAARRVRSAGIDGVEILFYGAALPQQFLSPVTNQRTDKYGGSPENRLRFASEIIQACRDAIGDACALSVKISGDELIEGGLDLHDMQEIVVQLDKLEMVDFWTVNSGNNMERMARMWHWPPTPAPFALHADLAAGIREVSTRPVAALSRIVSPVLAEQLLEEGKCDFVAVARAGIADPDFAKKTRSGQVEDIRPCVGANHCADRTLDGGAARCVHNPVAGREIEWGRSVPARSSRRVTIIGGGPAGLVAARVAAERGHTVTLFEKSGALGGNARVAASLPGRGELIGIVTWLTRQVTKGGVEIRLNTEATAESVKETLPEVVIVATGAIQTDPVVADSDASIPVVSALSVLRGETKVGRNILVVDHTGKNLGCGVAELALDSGGRAEVITRQLHPAIDFGLTNVIFLYKRIYEKGVVLTPHHDLRSVRSGVVTVFNYYSGVDRVAEDIDMVVMVTTPRSDSGLTEQLLGTDIEVHAIGDCVSPRDIEDATYEAHRVAVAV